MQNRVCVISYRIYIKMYSFESDLLSCRIEIYKYKLLKINDDSCVSLIHVVLVKFYCCIKLYSVCIKKNSSKSNQLIILFKIYNYKFLKIYIILTCVLKFGKSANNEMTV